MTKEIIPEILTRRELNRQLAADRDTRHKLFTGRPLNLPLTPGVPLAFIQVCLLYFSRAQALACEFARS